MMKTGLEKKIKNQLKEREIMPSEAAWQKLENMLDDKENKPKRKFQIPFWISVSAVASIALLILLTVNPQQNKQTLMKTTNIVHTETPQNTEIHVPEAEKITQSEETKMTQLNSPIDNQAIQKTEPSHNANQQLPQDELTVDEEAPMIQIHVPKAVEQLAQMEIREDSATQTKQKTDLVDPQMLLYSIEHNSSVKQKKSDSKLVIIDFNK